MRIHLRLHRIFAALLLVSVPAVLLHLPSPSYQQGGKHAYTLLHKTDDIRASCRRYMHLTRHDRPDIGKVLGFAYDPLVFNPDRFRRVKTKSYKLEGTLGADEREAAADSDFSSAMAAMLAYFADMEAHIHNSKVWGKCVLEHRYGKSCATLQERYYPWMTGNWPIVEVNGTIVQKPKDRCVLESIRGQGTGIVIPVVPTSSREKEVDSVRRLLEHLHGQSNHLPVQVVHQGLLSAYDKRMLSKTGQNVSFVDVEPCVEPQMVPPEIGGTFVHSLAALFNGFEDALLMTSKAVPNITAVAPLAKEGFLCFRLPKKPTYRPSRPPPGFHEVASAIASRLLPGDEEKQLFGFEKHDMAGLDDHTRAVDPTLMVVSKRSITGVLTALSLQLYHKVLSSRIADNSDKVAGEYLYLGHVLAGGAKMHAQEAIVAGIRTPPANLDPKRATMAMEVCSSSWGQMWGDHLIYVTAHQVENARDDGTSFVEMLRKKYQLSRQELVEDTDSFREVVDSSIVERLQENPLDMDVIVSPPPIDVNVYAPGSREPKTGWMEEEYENLNGHEYWCGYDLVGEDYRGRVYKLTPREQGEELPVVNLI